MRLISLSDRFFIPLAILLGAGLIYGAMSYRPIGQDAVIIGDRLLVEGSALAQLIPGPGTEVVFDPTAPGGTVARATARSSIQAAGNLSAGVGAVVPAEFESAVIGRDIQLSVTLRSGDPELTEVAIGYFTVGIGDSGWRMQTIPADGSPVVLRHSIPLDAPLGNNDWIGIWPDPEGAGRSVAISRIEVMILPEGGPAAP